MARNFRADVFGPAESVIEYLDSAYPGIKNDCTSFSLVKKGSGEVILTLNLVIDRSKFPEEWRRTERPGYAVEIDIP